MDYIKRIIDYEIDLSMEAFDAIQLVGPKGCGKNKDKTIIALEDEEKRDNYLKITLLFLQ